jgi:signal transduction histidine kinase
MKIRILYKLLLFSSIILAGNGFLGYAIYKSNQKLNISEKWVQHTEQVISLSGNILSLGKDIESASRGFVITNDSTYLEPLYNSEKTTFGLIDQLRQLVQDNRAQQQRVDSFKLYMHKRLGFSLQSVELRSKQGLSAAIAYVSNKKGKHYSDLMRHIINEIQQEESTLLKQRKQANERSVAIFKQFSAGMFIIMVVFTILLLFVIGKYLFQNKEKENRAAELIIANNELVFQNNEKVKRAVELDMANNEIIFQNEEKGKRAAELIIANKELVYQKEEKGKRAAELVIADKEILIQYEEKEKQIAANVELEAFSYSVSHDLRAPLRHIGGYIDLLRKNNASQLDKTGLRYLNTISESSNEMGNLIDALLTFSRLSRTELLRSKINSNKMVSRVLKTFSDELTGRNVKINISELPDIKGDEILIKLVWSNLISNALKYSRNKEKAVIDIGTKIENDKSIFFIKDNGVGFDMKYVNKLFGVFQRLHKATDFEGIGIGLADVNRIVVRHGGKCWAESEVGKGAAFFFSIPNN